MNAQNLKELQTNRFNEQIKEALYSNDFTLSMTFSEGIITQAKINTCISLKGHSLDALSYLKKSWNFKELELKRSGAGIKIEYTGAEKPYPYYA